MKTKIVIALVAILGWQMEAQTVTNTPSGSPIAPAPAQAQTITNWEGYVIPAVVVEYFRTQGYSDAEIQQSCKPPQPQTNQVALSPTPSDLKNATSGWTILLE